MPLQKRWLIAVSGGLDSVILCDLCTKANIDFVMAHCNFQLRGEESSRDENFVGQLAEKYQVPFLIKHFETQQYAAENKISIQVAARKLRYEWFEELLQNGSEDIADLAVLATAHHLDDNIETVLMNFCKGTGIAGLRGILPVSGNIIRPLLSFTKEILHQYAVEQNLQWVEDSSNNSDKYTRNYFRHRVVPAIEKIFPEVKQNLLNNIERMRDAETLYQLSVQHFLKKLVMKIGNEIHMPVLFLQKTPAAKTILFEATKPFGFTPHQLHDMMGLLTAENGKSVSSATHRIFKNRNWLIIAALQTDAVSNILIENHQDDLLFADGKLNFNMMPATNFTISNDSLTACIDVDKVKFPLLLRKWKTGDYFYPLGMAKKKKLSRFFIDKKLSLTQKQNTWVLEMDQKIIWVVGQRIDDRFKINPSTKNVLEIKFQPV